MEQVLRTCQNNLKLPLHQNELIPMFCQRAEKQSFTFDQKLVWVGGYCWFIMICTTLNITLLTGKDDDSQEWPVITGLMVNFKRHHIQFSSQILLPDPSTYSKPKKTIARGFSEPLLNGTTETVLSEKPANKHHHGNGTVYPMVPSKKRGS